MVETLDNNRQDLKRIKIEDYFLIHSCCQAHDDIPKNDIAEDDLLMEFPYDIIADCKLIVNNVYIETLLYNLIRYNILDTTCSSVSNRSHKKEVFNCETGD
ncbi:7229_t:CDS:2 [Entrophospora sp. SA101]|nr:7229_t:CDS:2 [Entrophospora sp. SA101]